MSARAITIDTLSFDDLLKIALADLPGASRGGWTLHGPVDPGITLLELFAAQFEQRLFMADQLTDSIVRASLRLLGVPDPAAALPATTVLSLTGPASSAPLPAGTVFLLQDDTQGRRFALDAAVSVLPVTGVAVSGRLLSTGDVLDLTIACDPSRQPSSGAVLSLLVELDAALGVAPAWRPTAVDVPPPAQLHWEAVGPDGGQAPVAVTDTTTGLRRSGILSLEWPAVWDDQGDGPRLLRATAVTASYAEPVRVLEVRANAALARHRVAESAQLDDQLAGFLALPGQRLRVPGAAGLLCDGEGDIVLSVTERTGERHVWLGVRSWLGCGPGDRVFLIDRRHGELRFGDGRSGRILRPAETPASQLAYHLGAGSRGNLGRWRGWAQEGGAALAVNPVAAGDGTDEETLDSARRRGSDAIATRDRTVTELDTEQLAKTTPGVGLARAHVSVGFDPAFPCGATPGALSVTIVPFADRTADPAAWTAAPQPDAGALAATRTRLEEGRLLGQEIFVLAPVYRRVSVRLTVSASGQHGDLNRLITDALRRYLDPLTGGSEHEGWPFGGPLRPSALSGVVASAIGRSSSVTSLSVALDGGPPSDCSDLQIGSRELVRLDTATITVGAATAGGGLR
ncbi:MAG: hypothetical protein QOH12_2161 [Solirubrobacteraceae bacterium]|nr:hypothetical protein [Solirubrobacteraceae bacterium]